MHEKPLNEAADEDVVDDDDEELTTLSLSGEPFDLLFVLIGLA